MVDEIYENVQHVEPWMSGNARGASTAFCLLHRLFTLKLSVRQVRDLLDHKDSPYIRAVRAGAAQHQRMRRAHRPAQGGRHTPAACGLLPLNAGGAALPALRVRRQVTLEVVRPVRRRPRGG